MIKKLFLIISVLSGLVLINPVPVLAFNAFPNDAVNCSDSKQANSSVCNTKDGDPLAGKDGIFLKITNVIAYIAGVAALIMIIVSGINFMTSNGDSAKVTSARHTLTNAIIGLVVIILAKTLITFVVVRL